MNEWSEGMLVKSMQTRAEVCREDQTVITLHVLAPLGMVAHSNSSNILVSFFGNNACTSQSLVTESTTLPHPLSLTPCLPSFLFLCHANSPMSLTLFF